MGSKVFGYVRISSKTQNESRQVLAIKDYCEKNNIELDDRDIFIDIESGKNFEREKYLQLKNYLRDGDTLIIKELDRLGRNKNEMKKELDYFKESNIRVQILNIPTTLIALDEKNKWLLEMVNNIIIEVLGAIAEEERNKIRERQREGIEIAKAKGKYKGRKKIDFPQNWDEVIKDWEVRKIKSKEAMELLNLKKSTFYKLLKEYNLKK